MKYIVLIYMFVVFKLHIENVIMNRTLLIK
jgi:hypothetical protein